MQYIDRANEGVKTLLPYQAGKPIEELERELGIENIIKLASNENPFGLPPSAKKAIQAQLDNLNLYPDSNGFYFKQAVAEKFGLQPEQITLGNGSNDLIELIAHTFASEQDEVIYSQYGFIVYPLISQALNAKRVEIPAKNYGNDLKEFLNAITPKNKLIYIANPNNPTGSFANATEITDFLAQVPPQVIVALDEAYVEFTEPSERVDSFGLLAKYPNLIVCRTLSKAYGLAGLRIGYAASSVEIAGLLNRVRQPFNCNSLALAAATAAIKDDEFVAKVAENNRIGLQLLQNFFDEKGLRYVPSKGNFVMLDLQQPAVPIYQALLRKGVIVRPLAGYGLTVLALIAITTGLLTWQAKNAYQEMTEWKNSAEIAKEQSGGIKLSTCQTDKGIKPCIALDRDLITKTWGENLKVIEVHETKKQGKK